ncbi:MAG: cobalamin-dependent protein [Desulfuromonadales bacterium]|nr:cobalamin-dependent protein [Desulfuromonadales bacterium]
MYTNSHTMKILLISTNRNTLPMPVMPIGACIMAQAAERAGHTVHLLDLMFTRDAPAAIEAALLGFKPDAVGLSVRNIDNNDMRNPVFFLEDLNTIVNAIRAGSSAPIILGGAALGVMPEQILQLTAATCAVIGDGERVFPLLLDHISHGKDFTGIPGVAGLDHGSYYWNAPAEESCPASCPTPDYRRWLDTSAYRSQMSTTPIQTKTGCQFQCVYCTYPGIEGRSCRLKDPASVADSVARLAAAGHRDIEIVDSVFNAPLEHAMNVCHELARAGHTARLQCLELNPRYFDDALMTAMERAGFVGMGITLESASDPVLQGLRKGFGSREVHHAAEVVRRHRIPCVWIFLFGGPGETEATVRETLHFARTCIHPRDVAFFNTGIRIYPGTELESIAREQGLLTCSPPEMLSPVFYLSPDLDARWLEQELKKAMLGNMNFITMDTMGLSCLPTIHRVCSRVGMRPPLWRHTRIIRRGLRLVGMDV